LLSNSKLFVISVVSPYKAPRNLQTSEPTKTSFRVTWDHAPGDVKGYKVTFHPTGEDVDLGELLVGPYDNTVVLEELRYETPEKTHKTLLKTCPIKHNKANVKSNVQMYGVIHSF